MTSADLETKISLTEFFNVNRLPVKAVWFTGVLRIGTGKRINGAGNFCIFPTDCVYERDIYFSIRNGSILSKHVVDNGNAGRFLSIEDRKWVFSGAAPTAKPIDWTDARCVNKHLTNEVPTRGVLNTSEYRSGKNRPLSRDKVYLSIPRTPASVWEKLDLILPVGINSPEDSAFVEVVMKYDAVAARYRVSTLGVLKRGETIHHPRYDGKQE